MHYIVISKPRYIRSRAKVYTLVFQMIVQVRIKVKVGKISKINKSSGWNKAMQVGIFQKLLHEIHFFLKISQNQYMCRME